MTARFVHNTAGEYVAFVAHGHLFTPSGGWLGVLERKQVFNPEGQLVGELLPDDRVVRDRTLLAWKVALRPRSPMRPPPPLPPKRLLFLPGLFYPLEDVFLGLRRSLTALFSVAELLRIDQLHGCVLEAADGTFLGRIVHQPSTEDAISNFENP